MVFDAALDIVKKIPQYGRMILMMYEHGISPVVFKLY